MVARHEAEQIVAGTLEWFRKLIVEAADATLEPEEAAAFLSEVKRLLAQHKPPVGHA